MAVSTHAAAHHAGDTHEVTGWVGWIAFASIMLFLGAMFQIFIGLVAVLEDTFYTVGADQLLLMDVTAWGWSHILLGSVLLIAAMSVMSGNMFGRIVAVLIALGAAVVNLAFVPVYPVWSIIALTVNLLVIYALVVHGREVQA